MLELANILRLDFADSTVNEAYRKLASSTEAIVSGQSIDNDMATAIIRELLRGQIAGSLQGARNASDAISMVQTFEAAASSINETLVQMQGLAAKAATGTYSDEQKAVMQQEFEELADGINDIVESTEFNGNKLLSADGETISIYMGNGSTLDIIAADLSLDIEGLDLTTNADSALTFITEAIEQTSSYRGYLGGEMERLEKFAALAEFDIVNAMGFETSISNTDLATEIAVHMLNQTRAESTISLLQTQANVTAYMALILLQD